MDIGFIGLGEMGAAMVANMLKGGHTVRVWNRSPERAQGLVAAGAQVVGSPAEAFTGDAVFSMLADDAALREVIKPGLLENAPRGLIHVNMATISVALAEELANAHVARLEVVGVVRECLIDKNPGAFGVFVGGRWRGR